MKIIELPQHRRGVVPEGLLLLGGSVRGVLVIAHVSSGLVRVHTCAELVPLDNRGYRLVGAASACETLCKSAGPARQVREVDPFVSFEK
jgi:hypothetical protein